MAAVRGMIGGPQPSDPPHHAWAVTPSDKTDLPALTTCLYIGTGGDVTVTMAGGEQVTFASMNPGWHELRVCRIWSTGTKAKNIIACWR